MRRIHSPDLLANVEDAKARAFVVLFTCDAFARSILISLVPLQAYDAAGRRAARQRRLLPGRHSGPCRQPDGARHPAPDQAPLGADDRCRRADGEARSCSRWGPRRRWSRASPCRCWRWPCSTSSSISICSITSRAAGSITSSRAGCCSPAAPSRWARGSASIYIATWRRTSPIVVAALSTLTLLTYFWTLRLADNPSLQAARGAAAEPAQLRVAIRLPSRGWCCPGCWRSAATAGG